jgi:hypothetical protein
MRFSWLDLLALVLILIAFANGQVTEEKVPIYLIIWEILREMSFLTIYF